MTFSLEKGDFLAVVGPSGSGKTTLLRIIDGLERADSGNVIIKGAPIAGSSSQLRRDIGMVFQNPVLFNTSVFNNVAYSLKFRKVDEQEVQARTNEILEFLRLDPLKGNNALSLSGGEAQRVALARVLVYRPDLLLLDEPTANLDPHNVSIIEDVLRRTNSDGTTLILVTHNVFQAKRLAGKSTLLLEGELVEFGATKSFFETPADPRVRAFVHGEMVY